ncbi:MAG: Uma2 family endonuclease [Chloroflexi bacterium]|nr:Uma2 family endonuclease [Chloroflexota bacterium]
MVAVPERWRFTVDEYHRMAEAGILTEDDRVELIDGEIVRMSPIGDPHIASVNRCNRTLSRAVGDRALVSIQNPINLDPYNEPEPDVALLRPRADDYARGKPGPADILLVIEVADTTLDYDRKTKLPRYGVAGIREAWLLDLQGDALDVHREPRDDGYALVRRYRRGEWVRPAAFPDVELAVEDLLPPADETAGR